MFSKLVGWAINRDLYYNKLINFICENLLIMSFSDVVETIKNLSFEEK